MLGAWLGAYLGIAAIPKAWKARLSRADRISGAIEKILADLGKSSHEKRNSEARMCSNAPLEIRNWATGITWKNRRR
jgi:hypothetical protein